MSPTLTKILVVVGTILTFGALAFIIYSQYELKAQQTMIQTQMVAQQQLVDGIVRAQSQYATAAQLAQFASDNNINLQAIKDNLATLSAQLTSITVAVIDSSGQNIGNLPSTGTGPANPNPPGTTQVPCTSGGTATCPNTDPFGYQKVEQDLAFNEDFATVKVPIGTVGFSAWQKAPWNINITPREYNIDTVVGTDANERQYVYNKVSVNVNGKTYDLPIKTATTKQQVPTASWTWWNPRAYLTAGGSVNLTHIAGDANLGATLGIMSYGKSLVNPDISVLQIGAGYQFVDKSATLIVNPVSVNIGHLFPNNVVMSTYIGPSVQVDFHGNVFAGVNLSIGF